MATYLRKSSPKHSSSSESSSSEEENVKNSSSSPLVSRRPINTKPRPTLFTVLPNYVPRIPDPLAPTVPLSPLGPAINVADGCVIIQSKPNVPSLDAGTSLFLDGGKPLGEIYETFGPVSTPFYVVVLPNSPCLSTIDSTSVTRNRIRNRYQFSEVDNDGVCTATGASESGDPPMFETAANAVEVENGSILPDADLKEEELEVEEKESGMKPPDCLMECIDANVVHEPESTHMITCDSKDKIISEDKSVPDVPSVQAGDMVYFVQDNPDLTIPVFYSNLVQMKGSDASWVNDTEPPPEELEFSDDEQERLHKRNLRMKRGNAASVNSTKTSYNNSNPRPSSSYNRQTGTNKAKLGAINHIPFTSAVSTPSGYFPAWNSHNHNNKPALSVPFCSTIPPPSTTSMSCVVAAQQPRPSLQQPAYPMDCSRPALFSSPIPSLPSSTAWPPKAPYGCPTDWPQPTWCPSMTASSSPAFNQVTSSQGSWNSTLSMHLPGPTTSFNAPGLTATTLNSTNSPQYTSPGMFFGCPGTRAAGFVPRQRPPPTIGGPTPCAIMNTGCPIGRTGPVSPMTTQSLTLPLVSWPAQAPVSSSGSTVPSNPLFTRYPPPSVRVQQPVMMPPHTVSVPVTFTVPSCSLMIPPSGSTSVYSCPPSYGHRCPPQQPHYP